jgi:hypothetical protein
MEDALRFAADPGIRDRGSGIAAGLRAVDCRGPQDKGHPPRRSGPCADGSRLP